MRYSVLGFLLYCSKKLLWILLVFLGITLISFFVMHLAPGSPTDMQTSLNPLVNEAYREKLNALYGLDKPIFIQYYDWLSRLVQFDFGNSLSGNGRPVLDAILERLPLTVGLNVTSLLLALFFAFPIGIISAVHQGKFIDKFFTFLVFLGFAMPGFWLALLLMLYLGIEHNLVPLSGITSLDFDTLSFTEQCLDVIHHLFLPVLVSTVGALAGTSRFLRSSMLEVLRQDYILTAKAKGLTKNIIIYKHALRNALLHLITLLGLSIPGLIGGSVIIESIFALPGLGQLFYNAVMARDYPLIMGNLVFGAVLTLAGNLLADFCYKLADPRISLKTGN